MSSFIKVSYESSDSEGLSDPSDDNSEENAESEGENTDVEKEDDDLGDADNESNSSGEKDRSDDIDHTAENDSDSSGVTDSDDLKSKDVKKAGSGLANVMSKILGKKLENNNRIILTKAKTEKEILQSKKRQLEEGVDHEDESSNKVKKKAEEHVTEDDNQEAPDEMSEYELNKMKHEKKKKWENMARLKPEVLEKEKERALQKIATRGVVQLFNAVKKQQKTTEQQLQEVGSSVRKRDKVLEGVDKGKFLDVLKGASANGGAEGDSQITAKDTKRSGKDKSDPSWNILREDYMMGAKMKDWDKDSDSDGVESEKGEDMEEESSDTDS